MPCKKRRYFQSLIFKLDGEIGEQRQTSWELLEAGELPDPVSLQLHMERLEMIRAHATGLLEQLVGDAGDQPASGSAPAETSEATLVRTEETTSAEPRDRLITVEEVAKLFGKSTSWVYERSMLGEIPRHKIGGQLSFRRSEVEAWIDAKAGTLL